MQKMRKIVWIILIIVILMQLCTPIASIAAEAIIASSDSRFQYTVNSDGTATITKYVGTDTEVVIPSSLDGRSVSSIGYGAFRECSILISIEIPEGVSIIRSYAFCGCRSLTRITIPESVSCIGQTAFSGCSSLTSINIPEGVTSIEYQTFYECSSLTSINIPEGVTSIGERAFTACTSLTNINIPTRVTNIGSEAFTGCSRLTNINIPEGVTTIGERAFLGCSGLTSINVDSRNQNYSSVDEILFDKEKTQLIQYPAQKEGTIYNIPAGVTSIGIDAFYSCSSLTSINIPIGVTNIGNRAFYNCINLTSISIPEGVNSIEHSTFYGCNKLTSISIPEGVTSIGNYAFYNCNSLSSINIPSGVNSIGNGAFFSCSSLISINIQEGITSIGEKAFCGCSNLSSIDIPESVSSIGKMAFEECSRLTSITISSGVTNIGDRVFYGCSSLARINVDENNKKYISEDGVLYNKNKTQLIQYPVKREGTIYEILAGVTNIGDYAFEYCNNLTSISVPEGVKSIGIMAFIKCSSLTSINIPEGVTNIGDRAFYGCSSLTSINIPAGVTNIGNYAFWYCSSLTSINIPEGVTSIGEGVFSNCVRLTTIKLSEKVTSIENDAFYGCSSLISIDIPAGVTSIGSSAFNGCSSLTGINIPEGVTSIGSGVFASCSRLTNIKFSEKVTSIGNNAFYGCSSLSNIIIPKEVTSIGTNAFYKCNKLNIICKSNSTAHTYAVENSIAYTLDDEGPIVTYETNGNSTPAKVQVTKVTISDDLAGVKENSLKYLWSTRTEIPAEENFTESLINGATISKNEGDGNWYLWILAKDNLENITIQRSEAFNLDNTAPIGTVTYNPNEMTNKNVIATITANEEIQETSGWEISSNKQSLTKEYEANNHENVIIKDIAGNEAQVQINVSNIDREAPTVTYEINGNSTPAKTQGTKVTIHDNLAGVEESSLKYLWSTNTETPTEESFKESFNNGETISKKEGDGNWYLWIQAKDKAGNATTQKSEAFHLDNTAPEVQLQYSITETTNQNVTVTITANEIVQELTGWKLSQDKQTLTKTYTSNTTETITIKDQVGNETPVQINVGNIDKEGPTVTYEINGNSTPAKAQRTKVTINDNLIGIEESSLKYLWSTSSETPREESFSESFINEETISKNQGNGNWYLWILAKDKLGNVSIQKSKVFKLDNTVPEVQANYSITAPTNQKVNVTIEANEKLQELEGWTISEDELSISRAYATNIRENIIVKDIAGNETQVQINVNNIDKTPATAETSYSTKELTNQNVVVTITANEAVQEVIGWNLSQDKQTLTKEYEQNVTETITIKDVAGNATQVQINVSNIDKTAPIITGVEEGKTYTKVTPQITDENLNKIILTKDGQEVIYQNGQEIKEKGSYTIVAEDKAGNKTTVNFTIVEKAEINMKEYEIKDSYITSIKPGTGITQIKNNIQSNVSYEIQTKEGQKVEGNTTVGTGMKIVFETGENYTIVVKGDTNGDGKASITDLTKIKKHITGQAKLENEYGQAGDLNANGIITVTDLAQMKKAIVGLIQL